ncbi:putative major facilitator superfamily transporter [Rhodococcus wratislaviensis NBRC 100605]|uniref:Putative major facilitator superfamily transporter n=2 Tax=Rhodococcus wratislaviensis TaxID=44752 RepID=X0R336_RHOWR|nr:putative major facilitator superfamily transporter [Rhodococcus wratislaviensis NBRC 100605]
MLLNFADKAVLGFAGVHIMKDLGLTPQQFGMVQSAFFWLFAVGAIVIGALTSKINVRWLLSSVMLVWIVTMLPLLGPVSLIVLLACRIMLGFAEGPAFALATHVVHSWFPPERRALPAGVVAAGASIGPLIAAPTLTWVIVTWSWHAAFGVLIAAGLVWSIAWLLLGKDAPESVTARNPETTAADDLPAEAPYRVLLTTGTIVGIALLTFFSYWSTTLKISWLPLFLSDGLGYDTITAGRLITLPYAVAAVASISAGLLSNTLTARGVSRRITRGYLTGGLVVAAGVSMFLFTTIGTGPLQMVLITLAFSLNTAAYAVAFVAVGDLVHPKQRGTILGCLVAFYSMAGVIAPLLLGHFVGDAADKASGYGQGFAITGLLMVFGGLAATFLVRPDRDAVKISARVEVSK